MPATGWESQGVGGTGRLAAVLLAVAVVVGTGLLLRGGAEQPGAPPTPLRVEDVAGRGAQPSGRLASPTPVPTPGVGLWERVPPAPIVGRHSAASLVFGRGVLVWGGRDAQDAIRADGAVYRADTREWYRLEDAPLRLEPARAVGLWPRPCPIEPCRGTVIVVGEDVTTGLPAAQRVDVRRRESSWRVLASPPDGRWVWGTAVWDGREVLLLEDTAATGRPARLVGYDPAADRWAERSTAPVAGWSGSRTSVAGHLLRVTGMLPGRARTAIATFDGQQWTQPDPAPVPGYWYPELVPAPAGGPLVVAGGHHSEGARAYVWSGDDGWTALPAPPGSHLRAEQHLARSGGRLIAWTGDARAGGMVLADLKAGAWEPVADAPIQPRHDAVVAWTGRALVVWGGRAGGDALDDGAVLRLP